MDDNRDGDDMLSGIDGPRPLPAALRQRLEDRLLTGADAARPLDPATAGRLSDALTQPEPPGPARRLWSSRVKVAAGGVAAGLLIAGGAVAALDRPGPARPAASASRSTASARPSPQAHASSGASQAGAAPQFNSGAPTPAAGRSAAAGPDAAASVSGVEPPQGPTSGGTWVTISGSHLAAAPVVYFGGKKAPRVTVISPSEIRAVAPAHPAGPVRVTVVNAAGAALYTYASP
ncbi:MAG TPA: IPT/TIG domain-containing protein [Acidimicrobiales bacterium]|nr:IPT/TIG domain-containing protein [Acidimicrobiales bacterium]